MKKLITLGENVDLLEIAYNFNGGVFVIQEVYDLIEYKRFLDQPLTKEMFEGDAAIFVGFEICNLGYKSKTHLIEFMNTYVSISLCVVYYGEEVYECIGNLPLSAPLHDLAELTKANQLELK
jgi:hypothetical protein